MESKTIAATDRSPEIRFDEPNRCILCSGEAYPEDATAFWLPIIKDLQHLLTFEREQGLTLEFKLAYFNSSSAKALMNIFQQLESAAEAGMKISANWYYQEGDDTMLESGEDFSEDLRHVKFNILRWST